MSCWALIGIKNLSLGKTRLSGALSPAARKKLIRAMLNHVLASLAASHCVQRIAIVTAQPLAVSPAVTLLPDTGNGLNGAIAHALHTLEAGGASELLVLHGDLALVTAAEIDELVASGRRSGSALAPDQFRQGTNAIYLKAGSGFEFHFGPHSFEQHRSEAARRALAPAIVELPGLAFDVDEPADLAHLLALSGTHYHFLNNHRATRHDDRHSQHTL